jgi:CubicO group peptidase (beta-lactamase class C family)
VQNVENGLVAMTAPSIADQFRVAHIGTPDKATLLERMESWGVPGVSIAVVDECKIIWAKGYGVRVSGGEEPVTTETLFEAASTTKLLASALALRLVDQGKLNLDYDVNLRLESWKIPDSEFTQDEKVTLRRLLTHQSGLNRPDGGFDEEEGSTPTLRQILKGETPALNDAAVVEFVPGSRHQYSNFGYLVIQQLLEDVTGKKFSQLARQTVFEALGMKNSTLVHPLSAEQRERSALPHDQELKSYDRTQSPYALAQGGLVTTPTDLGRFAIELMRACLNKSARLVSLKKADDMFDPELALDVNQYFGMSGQGLGVFLMDVGQHRYFLYPGQNNPGATCLLIASPDTGKGAVIMTNGAAGLQLSLEILAAIVNEYGWPTESS